MPSVPRRFTALAASPLQVFISGNLAPPPTYPVSELTPIPSSPVQSTAVYPEPAEGLSPINVRLISLASFPVDALQFSPLGEIEGEADDPQKQTDKEPTCWPQVRYALELPFLHADCAGVNRDPDTCTYDNE